MAILGSTKQRVSPSERVDAQKLSDSEFSGLVGKRMAVVSFSAFPGDPRPRRAAEAFAEAGMSVEVICLKEAEAAKKDTFKGIRIDRIEIAKSRNSKFGYVFQYCLFILIVFVMLTLRFPIRRYDVIHIHNMPDVLVFAALIPKLFGTKVILDLHDPMPELMMTIFNTRKESWAVRLMAFLEKQSITFADMVLTVNRTCEELFALRSGGASKISVVMNTPNEQIFRYSPVKLDDAAVSRIGKPFVIMYHGTLVERNGLDLAVEALAQVRQSVPEAELRVYGPRTLYLDDVLHSLSAKGLEEAVVYLGPRTLEELAQAIAQCDVGVIPNKRSMFTEINTPTRIFEYLALGKPVVAPRANGIEAYFDKDSLVLFELGNANDLAMKLSWVATHPMEALETTKRGQAIYQQHVWSREKEKLLNLTAALVRSR
ncbi:putative Glycosyl transferase group 1 [Candidatus Nitrospira nitrosa]|uniref:Putative Glycosyl transferase group 1 n=1 Tax=Candidatus Nitrospira nitrosa TaxID=1742972 RepID=A0A0S4LIR0_9BACT|nr:glycosyltransferase family 4 protein [Candidatus Nitrospira nitrosa]CUS36557.1 putative Glycosyl transferase group 1 [Candidatus Nitrospira nitrosa]